MFTTIRADVPHPFDTHIPSLLLLQLAISEVHGRKRLWRAWWNILYPLPEINEGPPGMWGGTIPKKILEKETPEDINLSIHSFGLLRIQDREIGMLDLKRGDLNMTSLFYDKEITTPYRDKGSMHGIYFRLVFESADNTLGTRNCSVLGLIPDLESNPNQPILLVSNWKEDT